MTATAPVAEPVTIIRVGLTPSLLNHYEAQAALAGTDLESFLAAHLYRTAEFTEQPFMYIGSSALAKLQSLLGGGRVDSAQKLVTAVNNLLISRPVDAGNRKLPILRFSVAQLEQISYRAKMLGKPFDNVFIEVVKDALTSFLKTA